ncbi:MAG: cupin domain-containing protein, partial [Gammaproteobacteria bacterium]|nr:cupin domain-containing protein [Gammaproteobacteria bacterium]
VAYVASGKFEVFIDGKKKILGPGDGFYIEPNTDHGAVCLEPGVLIDVFSPTREDFFEAGGY